MITSTRTTDVKTFVRCRRAWYFSRIAEVPEKSRRAFEDGTLVHRMIEMWLRNGEEPADLLGRVMVDALAAHGFAAGCAADERRGVLCEWAWALPVGDIVYTGKADLVDLSRDVEVGDVRLVDHKTTANIFAYAKTPAELATDLQLNVYAHAVFTLLCPTDDRIVVVHNYGQKGKIPVGRWVEAIVTRKGAAAIWDGVVLPAVEEMVRVSECPSAEDVEPAEDADACQAYGGCPFRSRCSAAASRRPKEKEMSMFDAFANASAPMPLPLPPEPREGGPVFDLYIDCEPVQGVQRGSVLTLDDWSALHRERVAADAQVAHYCMVEYGKGPALVMAWLVGDLAALEERALVVHGNGHLQQLAVEMLAPMARNVIRRVG